ncbi:uncharacterized protein MONBRDRAFT_35682 [Monosiga brevicollis MX1]|uniref:BRK domain-containing protein n=1 Tax=Monosiga brevicollis TaxID=81824 RepID=A9UQQ6_MONBE|nr:uncharacterized protein MONBRDRAFT_35682 [Monosiga brevicollis MX1]EDQ93089.1 predicted protein [Monosiga brevicollis MX1]|eukprot:XP_001742851.1 hypothetical protein [Monosiga brevicollis MX1]
MEEDGTRVDASKAARKNAKVRDMSQLANTELGETLYGNRRVCELDVDERVNVYCKDTGVKQHGNKAPLARNLRNWLSGHPTFVVGSPCSSRRSRAKKRNGDATPAAKRSKLDSDITVHAGKDGKAGKANKPPIKTGRRGRPPKWMTAPTPVLGAVGNNKANRAKVKVEPVVVLNRHGHTIKIPEELRPHVQDLNLISSDEQFVEQVELMTRFFLKGSRELANANFRDATVAFDKASLACQRLRTQLDD